jgi:RNA polymerase primary sigma factor
MNTEQLILDSLPIVHQIANKYAGYGVDVEDLVSEGVLGLLQAADKFDPDKQVPFSAYARYRVKRAILCALTAQRTPVRLPIYAYEWHRKILSGQLPYRQTTGPTLKTVLGLRAAFGSCFSLQDLDGTETTFTETIPDERATIPGCAETRDLVSELRALLDAPAMLSPLERMIITRRFGIGCPDERYSAIGASAGYTGERMRQIATRAIKRLRRKLEKYL